MLDGTATLRLKYFPASHVAGLPLGRWERLGYDEDARQPHRWFQRR